MDLDSNQNNAVAKLPLLKQGDYDMWRIKIEQFFQIQDYALWEVIQYGDSFKPTTRVTTNEDGTSTSTTITTPVTTEEKLQKKNDLKARSMLLMTLPNEHLLTFSQYKDAKTLASSTESLDSIFNRLQKIISQLACLGENISQDEQNLKFLRSLPNEWNTHVVVWRNKPDLDQMTFDDLYNNFKIVEQEVTKRTAASKSDSGSQNVAFVSTPTNTNDINTDSDETVYAFLSSQPNGSSIAYEDLDRIHDDNLDEIDLKWNLALLSIRARKFYQRTRRKIAIEGSEIAGYDKSKVECYNCHKMGHFARECRSARNNRARNQDNKSQEGSKKTVIIEDTSTAMVLNDKTCSNSCLKNYETLKNQHDNLRVELNKSSYDLANYKRGLASVEEQLVFYKKNEVAFCDQIAVLKRDASFKDFEINALKIQVENIKKEKESIKIKVDSFEYASKSLDTLVGSQISINKKMGIGFDNYNTVAPPPTGLFAPPSVDLSNSGLKEFQQLEFPGYSAKVNEKVSEQSPNETKKISNAPIIKDWVSDCDEEESEIREIENVQAKPKQANEPRKTSEVPRNNSSSWNKPMPKKSEVGFQFKPKACFVSLRAWVPVSTARPINTGSPKTFVNVAKPKSDVLQKPHSPSKRPFCQQTALKNRILNNKVNSAKTSSVNTGKGREVSSAVGGSGINAVKSSACWVWRPKEKVIDHDAPHVALKDTGIFDSGCSRHMAGNKSYLTDYEDYDGGFVAFAGSSKGGTITGKGKIKTEHLDFEDVYFVKELKFNLFSVSQMCDKKNSVLFTKTKCIILSPGFKLPNENQVMLKIPRKDNMYSLDLKNIVPSKGLTCLIANATNDESKMWHRRLGHINFKIMNKVVKGIENQLNHKVKVIRCDNGTEFKNYEINQFYEVKGIKREFSNARTPQYNRVAERKNRTLIEAAKTMKNSAVSFMRPFGCPVTILNTLDHLGKFDGKADEGFLVGYSINSKAFRVFNSRTRKVEENLHVNFLENKPNVAGSGPPWLFDIDILTNTMNYDPVSAGNRTNGNAGLETNSDASQVEKEKVPDQEYILLPLMHTSSFIPSSSEEDKSSPKDDAEKKNEVKDPAKEDDLHDSGEDTNAERTNRLNTGSSPVNSGSSSFSYENQDRSREQRNEFERVFGQDINAYKAFTPVNAAIPSDYPDDPLMLDLEDIDTPQNPGIFGNAYDNKDKAAEANMNNLDTTINVSPIPTTRVDKDYPKAQILGDMDSAVQTRRMYKQNEAGLIEPKKATEALEEESWVEAMQEELLHFKLLNVWTLVKLPYGKKAIGTKQVFRNKKDQRGIVVRNEARLVAQGFRQEEGIDYDEVFAPVARIEAIRLFLAYASYMDFTVYQMDVKYAFLYGTIEDEVYVCQSLGFLDPEFPDKVYKVEKALYGLHQALKAWYDTLSTYLIENRFRRGIINKTLFIKKFKNNILLVQVYVDDIIFGSTKKSLSTEFEQLMHKRFQMSSMGELTFFLGLQVEQRADGIFLSQENYVYEILKKFGYSNIKTASTQMETQKPLTKDENGSDVDVHLYRSMIGSLMYLTSSRPDIMFAVCACLRFQVQPKASHLHAVQVLIENPQHEVLWLQNQLLNYGYNFMKTKIHVDNESAICVVKNLVSHSKTKHIEIRFHFIRDCYEKRLIQMVKIHTDFNVADLLTKAFDVTRFKFLIASIVIELILEKHRFEDEWKLGCEVLNSGPTYKLNLHNMVAFLKKPIESEGFTEAVDFLKGNALHYALTHNPTVYDSLVKQFWQTATVRTFANGTQQIQASIDNKPYTITEASVRSKLHLADAAGINNLPDADIYAGLATLGNRIYNFSKLIFDGMVTNIESKGSAIPAGSQPSLDPIPTPTFVVDEATSTGVEVDTEGATTTTSGLDAGLDSGNIHESPLRSHETPPQEESKIGSLEKELKDTKQSFGKAILTLVDRVKTLEVALKRKTKKVVMSDSEDEETEAQGRKIQELDNDPLVSLVKGFVTPSKTSGEEQPKSVDKGRRYKRRKESKGKKVDTGLDFEDSGFEDISTGFTNDQEINTGSLETKTAKRQKIDDKDAQPSEEKVDEAKEEEPAKKMGKRRKHIARKGLHTEKNEEDEAEKDMDISEKDDPSLGTNVPINHVLVATKPPSIANYKVIKQGKKGVYQIVRENGVDKVYISFEAMLKDISKDDLTELYKIFMKKYGMIGPEDEYEKVLWEYMKNMFDAPLKSTDIYMLIERNYPLSAEVCKAILDKKLQGGIKNGDCYKLLKLMEKQAEQTATGKEILNSLTTDSLLKAIRSSMYLVIAIKH
ncbi:putative ribonuclease H-like domain-containing protein [Tanacetum coccineum]